MKTEKIYWIDIASLSDGWMTVDELCTEAEKQYDSMCITVGDVVYENDKYIIVCPTFDGDDMYHDASMILKSVIVKRELL